MIQQTSEDLVWSQIVARAWCDQAFMQRLRSDPRSVLAEHDLEVPDYLEVEVVEGEHVAVEDVDGVRRFSFPASPPDDLTDEDLGGFPAAFCFSGACAACAACGRCGRCACRCACRCF
jgi:hypothetical protein